MVGCVFQRNSKNLATSQAQRPVADTVSLLCFLFFCTLVSWLCISLLISGLGRTFISGLGRTFISGLGRTFIGGLGSTFVIGISRIMYGRVGVVSLDASITGVRIITAAAPEDEKTNAQHH